MHQHTSSSSPSRDKAGLRRGGTSRPTLSNITAFSSTETGGCEIPCALSADQKTDGPGFSSDYSWHISGMDCPACARKIENAVNQLADVASARVLFATQKLVISAPKDVRQQVEQAVAKAGFRLRATTTPSKVKASFWQENGMLLLLAGLLSASWLLQAIDPFSGKLAFTVTTLAGCWPIASRALRLIRSGTPFAIETLMTVAALGALFIGAAAEAAMVLLLFMLGERLEAYAASRARRGVTALMALKPEKALRIRHDIRETVAIEALCPGDIIEVTAGGRLPADASLITPLASFDESALTGESVPVERHQGEIIAAGSLSIDRLAQLKVVSRPGQSAIDRILHLIEEADAHRAPVERFLDRFSRVYTPLIMAFALLVAAIPPLLFSADWQPWIYKGLTLLLIGCPCALVISTPAAITSGLAAAARRGVLIKGGAALENLNKVQTLAFDKTGTLTEGKPQVRKIVSFADSDETALLAQAAAVEQGSSHPLAKAIVQQAERQNLLIPAATNQRMLAGTGAEARVSGHQLQLFAPGRLTQTLADWQLNKITELEAEGNTVIVLMRDEQPAGLIALRDTLRADTAAALSDLHSLNIATIMLTGDNPRAAAAIAGECGIDYRAALLPEDKVAAIHKLARQRVVAMVGDGINDAPAMKAATLGIAMGGGSDVALETADAALTHNRLSELAAAIRLARATHANIRQNIVLALGLKGLFLITTLLGMTGLWLAVLADSGATALVTANALRLLSKRI